MEAAVRCLNLVEKALKSARLAQGEIAQRGQSHFDLMAINTALEHLERAHEELSCFGTQERNRRS
jgi:hypothetical protein